MTFFFFTRCRTIDIPEFLKNEIRDYVNRLYKYPDDERIFPVVAEAVQHKMKNHIENLDSSKKEQLIENLAKKAKAVTGDAKVTAIATGNMTKASAEKILKNVYGTSCLKVEENHKHDDDLLAYGIILSTEDRKITCRLTLEEKTNEILSQKREQLALALFGGRLPE